MSAQTRHPDVAVVGAGVIGAACAAALARDGVRVTLIDADFAGGGSTGVAMGHVVVLDDSDAQLTLSAYSRSLWAELSPTLPPDCEDERRGTLWIAANEAELSVAGAKRTSVELLSPVAMTIRLRSWVRPMPTEKPLSSVSS